MPDFDVSSFLAVNLAEEIDENDTVVQGTAAFIPLVSAALAMKKKNFNYIGCFSSNPKINPKIPSTFSPSNYENLGGFLGLSGFLDLLQAEKIDLEFLRPAQVDKFGNINNTFIGKNKRDGVRLPGGMGIEDVVRYLKRPVLYVPNHSKRVFVEKVDFITSSGWDSGKGPEKIITNMCIFEFPNRQITLTAINPIFSVEDVKKETGFEFKVSKNPKKMKAASEEEMRLIREIDPFGIRDLEIAEKRKGVLMALSK